MLHHASLNARNPRNVAETLAEMLETSAIRAPSPPFPVQSWFVCYGDAAGSLLEILPWGTVLDQNAPMGVGHDGEMRRHNGSHVLISTPRGIDAIQAIASREGWQCDLVDARLFQVVKVWIENAVLVEFLTPEIEASYRAAFGAAGIASLDSRLRELENSLLADISGISIE